MHKIKQPQNVTFFVLDLLEEWATQSLVSLMSFCDSIDNICSVCYWHYVSTSSCTDSRHNVVAFCSVLGPILVSTHQSTIVVRWTPQQFHRGITENRHRIFAWIWSDLSRWYWIWYRSLALLLDCLRGFWPGHAYWALAFVLVFSFIFWSRVLDQSNHTVSFSVLNSPIVSYSV